MKGAIQSNGVGPFVMQAIRASQRLCELARRGRIEVFSSVRIVRGLTPVGWSRKELPQKKESQTPLRFRQIAFYNLPLSRGVEQSGSSLGS